MRLHQLDEHTGQLSDAPKVTVTEAGGYYTQPVYDMIEQHGYEKVMAELLSKLDADVIQDFLNRADLDEATETCEDCGCTIGQPETGCECSNHDHANEDTDLLGINLLKRLAGI